MPTLYDQFGRPIKAEDLTREIAEATLTGVRNIWHESVAMGLTPATLATILTNAAAGDMDAYLTLAEEMEERDMHYSSVLHTRKIAVSKLELQVIAPTEDPLDIKIADEVRAMLHDSSTGQLTLSVLDLLDAFGKGFSAIEIEWDRSERQWNPRQYKHRDCHFFQFDRVTGHELRIRDEEDMIDGLALPPYRFIVHYPKMKTGIPIRGGFARLVAFGHMCKSYALKDWVAFAEVFGMPIRVGKYGPGATDADKTALLTAVANIGTDAAAIMPENMILEFIDAKREGGGGVVFEKLANYLDKQASKAVLGQTMTTDDGSSKSQAEVHDGVRGDIRDDDVLNVSGTITKQLVIPWVILNHGAQKRYPYAKLVVEHDEDLGAFSDAVAPLVDRGLPVEIAQVLDKFRLVEPADGAAILTPVGAGRGGGPQDGSGPGGANSSMQQLLKSLNAVSGTDEMDRRSELAASGWREQMDPVLGPVIALADRSRSFEEFSAGLADVLEQMDPAVFAEKMAVENFKMTGLGDGTDEIK